MKNLNLKIRTIKKIKLTNDNLDQQEYKSVIRYDSKKIRSDKGYKRALNYVRTNLEL